MHHVSVDFEITDLQAQCVHSAVVLQSRIMMSMSSIIYYNLGQELGHLNGIF
jgi:hypothetical protein